MDINADWFCQFESINDLRRLNKYHPKLFLEVLQEILLEFVKLVVSLRSNIAKLALILLTEFFENKIYFVKKTQINFAENDFENCNNNDNYDNNNEFSNNNLINNSNSKSSFSNASPKTNSGANGNKLSEFSVISKSNNFNNNNRHSEFNKNSNFTPVKNLNTNNNYNNNQNHFDLSAFHNTINSIFDTVLPYILQQSCIMKAFLKEEASKCLEKMSSCTQSFYFLKKLNMQINNKNASYAENAYFSAQALMQNLLSDSEIFDSQNPSNKILISLKDLIDINIGLHNLKKDMYAKKAVKLVCLLKELIGSECFEAVKGSFDNNARRVIDSMLMEGNKGLKNTGKFNDLSKKK